MNFAVFHCEVLGNQAKAIEITKNSLTDALEKIDDVDEEVFKDARPLIDMLKENLENWNSLDATTVGKKNTKNS